MSSAQVPEGYKQTEVGVIPEDWKVGELGSLGKFKNGINKGSEDFGHGSPFVNLMDVFGVSYISEIEHLGLVNSNDSEKNVYNLKEGDVLFIRSSVKPSGVGLTSVVKKDLTNTVYSGFLIRFRDQGNLKTDYKKYCFYEERFRQSVISNSTVSANTNINQDNLKKLVIAYPESLGEQRAIAQALSDVDSLIASLDKLIAKQRQLKTAAMQQLLTGKMRLPEFGEGKGYRQSEIGVIPEDWDVKYLGEVGQSLIGLTYRPEDTRDYGTLVLRSSNVQNDRLAYENNVYVDSALPLPPRVIVEEGDILICVRNGSKQLIGKCALIDTEAAGSAFGAFMSVYRTMFSRYLFYQFQSDVIQTQINEIMGATINQITNKDMAAFQIPLPPSVKEQGAIATVLSDMDTAIAALETRRAKTQAIKQGMMQELLTGRTRLV